jgi:lysophospholipid acyltransferase (LPLAT)-like uncharacterized protein
MKRKVLIYIGLFVLRLLAKTWRIRVVGNIPIDKGVVIVWHGMMLIVWKFFSGRSCVGVTSHSKDGDVLARLLDFWDYRVLRGSSSRGGKEVLASIVEMAKRQLVIMTPDGPRGPAEVAKAGAFVAAQRSGTMLYCCRVHIKSAYRLSSWDSFAIPYPFSSCTIEFFDAIRIESDADREEVSTIMELMSAKMRSNM